MLPLSAGRWKFLKARLQAADIRFPKTHALSELLALIAPVEPLWLVLASPLPVLESYAVEAQYPGRSVTRREALEAMRIMRQVRGMVRERLVPGVGRRSKK